MQTIIIINFIILGITIICYALFNIILYTDTLSLRYYMGKKASLQCFQLELVSWKPRKAGSLSILLWDKQSTMLSFLDMK